MEEQQDLMAKPAQPITLGCGNCFYAQAEKVRVNQSVSTQTVLFCHRNPPIPPNPMHNLPYPMVHPERDWCGEFLANETVVKVKRPEIEADTTQLVTGQLRETNKSGIVIPKT